MANPCPKNSLSCDTNLLIDLGGELDYALTFVEVIHERRWHLYATPTAVAELTWLAISAKPVKQASAAEALRNLGKWKIRGKSLTATDRDITEQFARRVLDAGLLPPAEVNDAEIIAETARAGIPYLITSDAAVTGIDQPRLQQLLAQADLSRVTIIDPRRFLRLIRA
jgi:predicted nucleic acid-binding protein